MRRLIALACFAAALCAPAHADPVFPRGLHVGLEPAGALRAVPNANGFQDPDRKASVAIAEFPPAAYDGLVRAIFGKAPTGATEVERENFAFHDGLGYLHVASVVENGVTIKHWILLATPFNSQDPAFVAVVNVNVEDSAAGAYPDATVRAMLASMRFRNVPVEEQIGLLPFTLGNLAGFRILEVQGTEGAILTAGPLNDISRQPYMILSIGRSPFDQADDRERFARDMLINSPLRGLSITGIEPMRIGGYPGIEVRARAKDVYGNDLTVVQWLRFNAGTFLRIIGASRTETWDEMFNRFRAVRDGIDLR